MADNEDDEELSRALQLIKEALRGLRFGAVEVQVHETHIVRITRTEKVRVEANCRQPA